MECLKDKYVFVFVFFLHDCFIFADGLVRLFFKIFFQEKNEETLKKKKRKKIECIYLKCYLLFVHTDIYVCDYIIYFYN